MKYQVTAEQLHFFEKNSFIEFEELFSKQELQTLATAYQHGTRDLALHNLAVKEILFQPRFSQIAAELSGKRLLRYGLDEKIKNFESLKDERCVQGLEIAMLLYIDPHFEKYSNAIFFLPTLSDQFFDANQTWVVLAWANRDALYVLNAKDPFTHNLKKQGYVFGDRLKETTHPVLWR